VHADPNTRSLSQRSVVNVQFLQMETRSLYYFGNDFAEERLVLDGTTSGGVTINDSRSHHSVDSLPFGKIGPSGMGAYRGKTGFVTFSHARSVHRQSRSPQAEHVRIGRSVPDRQVTRC
jgi:hypothetical protein